MLEDKGYAVETVEGRGRGWRKSGTPDGVIDRQRHHKRKHEQQ